MRACPPHCSFGVCSHGSHHVPHVGCPGLDPQDRVRTSGVSAGLGCQRGRNPGVLQTPGVSSSAATDTGARRHTRAFWVDAVSKQTEVELQPAASPPATAVSFRLRPYAPVGTRAGCRLPLPRRTQPQTKSPGAAGWELGSKRLAFWGSGSAPGCPGSPSGTQPGFEPCPSPAWCCSPWGWCWESCASWGCAGTGSWRGFLGCARGEELGGSEQTPRVRTLTHVSTRVTLFPCRCAVVIRGQAAHSPTPATHTADLPQNA